MKEIYPEATEDIDPKFPEAYRDEIPITIFVDANWANDKKDRRSITGYIIYLGKTPIKWYSKKQSAIATSTYGSEFLALKTAIEEVTAIRYTLRSFGMKVETPTRVKCDKESFVKSSTLANSVLKKRYVAIGYNMARISQAAGIIQLQCACSAAQRADAVSPTRAKL